MNVYDDKVIGFGEHTSGCEEVKRIAAMAGQTEEGLGILLPDALAVPDNNMVVGGTVIAHRHHVQTDLLCGSFGDGYFIAALDVEPPIVLLNQERILDMLSNRIFGRADRRSNALRPQQTRDVFFNSWAQAYGKDEWEPIKLLFGTLSHGEYVTIGYDNRGRVWLIVKARPGEFRHNPVELERKRLNSVLMDTHDSNHPYFVAASAVSAYATQRRAFFAHIATLIATGSNTGSWQYSADIVTTGFSTEKHFTQYFCVSRRDAQYATNDSPAVIKGAGSTFAICGTDNGAMSALAMRSIPSECNVEMPPAVSEKDTFCVGYAAHTIKVTPIIYLAG